MEFTHLVIRIALTILVWWIGHEMSRIGLDLLHAATDGAIIMGVLVLALTMAYTIRISWSIWRD